MRHACTNDFSVFLSSILNLTEEVGDMMVGYEGSYSLIAPAVAISVVDVVPGQFSSLSFGVSSDRNGTNPEVGRLFFFPSTHQK